MQVVAGKCGREMHLMIHEILLFEIQCGLIKVSEGRTLSGLP